MLIIKEREPMKEIGQVVALKGNIAVVQVERDAPGDCCRMDKKALVLLEAPNGCGAGIGDPVYIESGASDTPLWRLGRLGGGLGFFTGGLLLGDYAASGLGLASLKELFSLAAGVLLGLLFYRGLRILAGKQPEEAPILSMRDL
ncbi:MAG: hypothetical protein LBQ30_03075 [Treponema sp.]|jgi:hypothetical protein|nr:hypothetical protein [Treponema sp.]